MGRELLDPQQRHQVDPGGHRRAAAAVPVRVGDLRFGRRQRVLNHEVAAWLRARDVEQTRSGPYQKNDQAHVESKNNHVVRKHAFYWRYDTVAELALLDRLWPVVSLRLNYFTPTRKAVSKGLPGVKAPSTLGPFLRAFTFGHVRQLGAVAAALLIRMAVVVNILSAQDDHRDAVTWLDVDDTMRETHGYTKQGVGYGYNKVKGLNALLGMVSTPVSAPIIVAHHRDHAIAEHVIADLKNSALKHFPSGSFNANAA